MRHLPISLAVALAALTLVESRTHGQTPLARTLVSYNLEKPDLLPELIQPDSLGAQVVVANVGPGPSKACRVELTVLRGARVLTCLSHPLPILLPGQSVAVVFEGGTHNLAETGLRLIVRVDPGQTMVEENRMNNTLVHVNP